VPAVAAVALGITAAATAVSLASAAQSARAAATWPAHVFAPYVDTGLSNTTLTTVAAHDAAADDRLVRAGLDDWERLRLRQPGLLRR